MVAINGGRDWLRHVVGPDSPSGIVCPGALPNPAMHKMQEVQDPIPYTLQSLIDHHEETCHNVLNEPWSANHSQCTENRSTK